ncbi:MAG: CarD family transcriptional regulator [Proteobacteria bacterium]|nr:CarD family transcriptional regulator [Pseudomonadota bacterium]
MQNQESYQFKIGDSVVYPAHGVGVITGEEIQTIGGTEIHLYIISFARDKMILRIPKSKIHKSGLRHLMSKADFGEVLNVLQKQTSLPRGMWSKRAQEYSQKINSGNILQIAEVLRDLHKNAGDPDCSYSERIIYESALERLSNEYAESANMKKPEAKSKLIDILDSLAI